MPRTSVTPRDPVVNGSSSPLSCDWQGRRPISSSMPFTEPTEADLSAGLALAEAMVRIADPRHARAIYAGKTFGEFVAACYQAGLTSATPLASIEFGVAEFGKRRIVVEDDEFGASEIREVIE